MFKRFITSRLLVVCIAALLLSGCALACVSCSSSKSLSQSKQDELKKTLTQGMAGFKVPGAIVGMWFPDQGNWVVGQGVGDKSTGAAPQTTDKVRIGSLSKTFTATVMLQLVDEKKLSLDDKLSKYEPQVPGADGISIRQLLNMTSGLFNYTDDESFWTRFQSNPNAAWAPEQMVDIAIAHPAVFPPGQKYMYSNTNYILLGMIMEKVTGNKAGDEITTRIINKLGLKNTSFPMDTKIPSPYMHGYLPAETGNNDSSNLVDFSIYSPTPFWTAGGMISNLNDLKTWAEALGTGKLLSKQMHDEQVKFTAPNTDSYGLGVMHAGTAMGHSGEIPGYNSSMYYIPTTKSVSIVLINRYPSKIEGAVDVINGALIKTMIGQTPASTPSSSP